MQLGMKYDKKQGKVVENGPRRTLSQTTQPRRPSTAPFPVSDFGLCPSCCCLFPLVTPALPLFGLTPCFSRSHRLFQKEKVARMVRLLVSSLHFCSLSEKRTLSCNSGGSLRGGAVVEESSFTGISQLDEVESEAVDEEEVEVDEDHYNASGSLSGIAVFRPRRYSAAQDLLKGENTGRSTSRSGPAWSSPLSSNVVSQQPPVPDWRGDEDEEEDEDEDEDGDIVENFITDDGKDERVLLLLFFPFFCDALVSKGTSCVCMKSGQRRITLLKF